MSAVASTADAVEASRAAKMGICPNCKTPAKLDALNCDRCNADFSSGSGWRVLSVEPSPTLVQAGAETSGRVRTPQEERNLRIAHICIGIAAVPFFGWQLAKLANVVGRGDVRSSQTQTASAAAAANANDVCANAKFSACFVNSDGATCQNQAGTPIGQLMSQGNFTVTNFELQGDQCLLTVHVQGQINGNSYSRSGKVWAYR